MYLMPEEAQYDRNKQHALTGLIKYVVVAVHVYQIFST
jgi:hypothetical protein